jgi:hypothetical protein
MHGDGLDKSWSQSGWADSGKKSWKDSSTGAAPARR